MTDYDPSDLDAFLAENPECADGVRVFDTPAGLEPYMNLGTLRALFAWMVARGGHDPEQIRSVWLAAQSLRPGVFVGPPPV